MAVAVEQEKAQAVRMEGIEGKLPRTFENGEVKVDSPYNWVSGFFPGSLWLLYEYTGDEQLRTYADEFTRRLEVLKDYKGTHDLGFMIFCSYRRPLSSVPISSLTSSLPERVCTVLRTT